MRLILDTLLYDMYQLNNLKHLIYVGERPYACQVDGCEKRFTEYSSLYKHHVVHTHNKPYTCTICNKTYRQASTLALHKRTSHGDMSGITMAEG